METDGPSGLPADELPRIQANSINDERAPLLSNNTHSPDAAASDAVSKTKRRRLRVVAICALLNCLATAVRVFMITPVLRIVESRVCADHYRLHQPPALDPDGNISEEWCKEAPIQVEVAFINTAIGFLAALTATLVAIPYGMLGDRCGRRLVLFLNALGKTFYYAAIILVGFSNTLPPRLLILTGLFQLLGGGTRVNVAILYAVISDVAEPAARIDFFYYLELADYVTELVAPPAAFFALKHSLVTSSVVGIGLSLLTTASVSLLPETRPSLASADQPGRDQSSLSDDDEASSSDQVRDDSESTKKSGGMSIVFRRAKAALKLSDSNPTILVILLVTFTSSCAITSMYILPQYASKELQWPVRTTAYLSSIRALVELFLFWLLLPGIKRLAFRWRYNTQQYSIGVVRGSLVVATVGSIVLALAQSTPGLVAGSVLCAFGDGLIVNLRALAISLADAGHGAVTTTRMAAVSTLGQMAGRPLMLLAFKWDNEGEVGRKGSPFLASAILYGCTLIFVLVLRSRWRKST